MPTPAPRLLPLLALAALPAAARADPLPVCPVADGQVAEYEVLRGGSVIGAQTLRFGRQGDETTVTADIHAELHALGIRVYTYTHHGEERWRGGELVALTTRTDDDGTPRRVEAVRDPRTGWRGVTGMPPGPAPLVPTSMWNSRTVTQTRLLDRETGEVVPVQVATAGAQSVALGGGRSVMAQRFDLAGPVKGSLWYDGAGCWVRALFHTRVDGSLVEVRAR